VDYFDLVTGTSTGGLITAIITNPSTKDPTLSLFTAISIAATIFPQIKYKLASGTCSSEPLSYFIHHQQDLLMINGPSLSLALQLET
jgi:patatin-like phospholipase/acyl hydrolase